LLGAPRVTECLEDGDFTLDRGLGNWWNSDTTRAGIYYIPILAEVFLRSIDIAY